MTVAPPLSRLHLVPALVGAVLLCLALAWPVAAKRPEDKGPPPGQAKKAAAPGQAKKAAAPGQAKKAAPPGQAQDGRAARAGEEDRPAWAGQEGRAARAGEEERAARPGEEGRAARRECPRTGRPQGQGSSRRKTARRGR